MPMGLLETVKTGLKNGRKLAEAHMPTILAWLSIGGVWTTAALAAYETPEFMRELELQGLDDPEIRRERWFDTGKVAVKSYYPAIISGTITSLAMGKSNSESLRREAAAIAMARASALDLRELKDKIISEQGEKGLKEIQNKIAQDHMDKDPVPEDRSQVVHTGFGLSMMKEPWSGQYLYSNYKNAYDAANVMRKKMYEGDFVPIEEWLYAVGVRISELSESQRRQMSYVGWIKRDLNDIFDIMFGECRAPNGEPCNEIIFWREPDASVSDWPFRN